MIVPRLQSFGKSASQLEYCFLLVVLGAATFLLLSNLSNQYLWQDEAQTATISKTILKFGIPVGYDGKNYFSQEFGFEYGKDYVWKWHTWFSFYLAAASFAIFGQTTFAARFPFALFGIATVILIYFFSKALFQSRRLAATATVLVLISVPFLILSRQCRYYSPVMFFCVLGLFAYLRILEREKYAVPTFIISSTLLFHSHYIYSFILLVVVGFHVLLFRRERFFPVLLASASVVILNLPWIIFFSSMRYGHRYPEHLFDVNQFLEFGKSFFYQLGTFVFPPVLLVIPIIIGGLKLAQHTMVTSSHTIRARKAFSVALVTIGSLAGFRLALHLEFHLTLVVFIFCIVMGVYTKSDVWKNITLLVLFLFITLAALLVSIPYPFFRYLAPLVPILCILMAVIIEKAMQIHIAIGIEIIVILALIGSMPNYLYEITHDYDGPVEGIVNYLNQNGSKSDTVIATYDDLPLKFYTNMKIVGGLTGEDLAPYINGHWIIIRKFKMSDADSSMRLYLRENVDWKKYQAIKLGYPDIPYENREDPRSHLFRTASIVDSVVLFRRID